MKKVLLILSCVVGSMYAADTKKYLYETPMVMPGSTEGYLANLPEDLQRIIVTLVAQAGSADEAADAIRALMDTNKQFFNIINTQEAVRVVIDLIARTLNGSHEEIARRIHTKAAQEYVKRGQVMLNTLYGRSSSLATLRQLAREGYDLQYVLKSGAGALYIAVEKEDRDMITYLVAQGADVNVIEKRNDFSLLHKAVHGNNFGDIASILLPHMKPAIINKQGKLGNTVLLTMIYAMHLKPDPTRMQRLFPLKSIELLLQSGADVSIQNQASKTALDAAKPLATRFPNSEYVQKLIALLEQAEKERTPKRQN